MSAINLASQQMLGVLSTAARRLLAPTEHEILIRGFIESMIKSGEPPITAEEGKRLVETMETISAQCGFKI